MKPTFRPDPPYHVRSVLEKTCIVLMASEPLVDPYPEGEGWRLVAVTTLGIVAHYFYFERVIFVSEDIDGKELSRRVKDPQ